VRKKTKFEVKRGNVVVSVYRTTQVKNGKRYINYTIPDYSNGQRRMRYAADLEKARQMAGEIAEAIANGKADVLKWEDGLRVELRKALEAVSTTGVTILPATQLFAEAVKVLGSHEQLLSACHHWIKHRPDKPFTPKPTKEASEHLVSQGKNLSPKRQRNIQWAVSKLNSKFGEIALHEIDPAALKNFALAQAWNNKTRNEFLGVVGLLFKEAQIQGWVEAAYNPAKVIGRFKEPRGTIGIFEPWEVKQMLSRLAIKSPELVPFLALWCFAGIRLYEISRLTWPEVNRGLTTGFIELEARKTKTGEARAVPVSHNLKAWLTLYRKDTGTIIPEHRLASTSSTDDRLAELPRHIARKTGVVWRSNAPRHSFATFHLKLHKDAGATVQVMGTSLQKLQHNYWAKSKCVTEESAKEWFAIAPDGSETLVALPAVA